MEVETIERFAGSYDGRLVAIGSTEPIDGVHSLSLDEVGAARLVVDHLRSAGRSRVAILANEWHPEIVHPRDGWPSRPRSLHSGCPVVSIVGGYRPTIDGGAAALTELISTVSPDGVDAAVVFNDTMAIGAMHACRRLRPVGARRHRLGRL